MRSIRGTQLRNIGEFHKYVIGDYKFKVPNCSRSGERSNFMALSKPRVMCQESRRKNSKYKLINI